MKKFCQFLFPVLVLVLSSSAWSAGFSISNGNIIGPNGQIWQGRGMNVYDSNMGNFTSGAFNYASLVPKLSFIRLDCYSFQSPSYYDSFINLMTGLGIVVIMEDHQNSIGPNGGNAGGGQGVVPTGTTVYANGWSLPAELTWYGNLATHYINNPYVWFGTDNEPPNTYTVGQNNQGSLTTWQQQTYNAIRNTGNNSIIAMELFGGGDAFALGANNSSGWYPSSTYNAMHGIIADYHMYSYVLDNQTNTNHPASDYENCLTASASSTCLAGFGGPLALIRQTTSADGTLPVMIGEYGPSTVGTSLDTSGNNLVTAIQTSAPQNNLPTTAWNFYSGDCCNNVTNGSNQIATNGYGTVVQSYINAGAGPVLPITTYCTPSVYNTVMFQPGTYITDQNCNQWGINTAGLVTFNGVPVTFTANVTELFFTGSPAANTVWQENAAGNYYWFNPGANTFGGGPTTTSPIANATCGISVDKFKVATVGPVLYDKECNAWALNSSGNITFNGTIVPYSANLALLVYLQGPDVVWQQNTARNWYNFVSGTDNGNLGPTLISPLVNLPLFVTGN